MPQGGIRSPDFIPELGEFGKLYKIRPSDDDTNCYLKIYRASINVKQYTTVFSSIEHQNAMYKICKNLLVLGACTGNRKQAPPSR